MTQFTTDFSRERAGFSPDRVDAAVYALTEVALGGSNAGEWAGYYSGIAERIERGEMGPGTIGHTRLLVEEKARADVTGRPMRVTPLRPTKEDEPPITLRTLRPHELFCLPDGTRFSSGADRKIPDVPHKHVEALCRAGAYKAEE